MIARNSEWMSHWHPHGTPMSVILNAMCYMSANQWAASVEKRRAETADSSCICRTRRQCGMNDTVDVVILCTVEAGNTFQMQ